LKQDATFRIATQGASEPQERARAEAVSERVKLDRAVIAKIARELGRPDFDAVAGRGQSMRDDPGIVADSARLRRILAGDDPPNHAR
jgi:hypothetical protein